MSYLRFGVVVVVLAAILVACTTTSRGPDVAPRSAGVIRPGLGEFTFDGYAPLRSRPVKVYYEAPDDPATAQILIVMHGVGRNAEDYRTDWHEYVRSRNVLVLAPEFSDDEYPDTSYALGNMVDRNGHPRPQEQWSFHVVEALFDFAVRDVGSSARDYALFGHSAGAQFVHRFVEFMPDRRTRVAVAANAGWYTMPDDSVAYPYGLGDSPATEKGLTQAFATDLVVLLGGDDVDPENDSLRRDRQSDAQGTNRLDRGRRFYATARDVADANSAPFHWRTGVVPGVAHDHTEMSRVAAPILLGDAG